MRKSRKAWLRRVRRAAAGGSAGGAGTEAGRACESSEARPGDKRPPSTAGTTAGATTTALQEQLLAQLERAALECEAVERELQAHAAPELEAIIKLHRVLVLKLSLEAKVEPELFQLVKDLMRPLLEWARLEEKRQDRAFAEQKHRERLEAQKAATGPAGGEALRAETLARIERELKLL